MAAAPAEQATVVEVSGITTEAIIKGSGRDILFLNSGSWLADESPFVHQLAALGRVIAPIHPGFGSADAPAALTTVDDLAYFYLDLIDQLKLEDVLLVGASFGAWIAAEMVVKGDAKIASLALVGPFGIKAGSREERSITDVFAIPDKEIEARSFVSPDSFHREVKELSDTQLAHRIRSREALARFGWSPYMHDPKLPGRLHRTQVPASIMWGTHDRMVTESCARLYADKLPNGRFVKVEGAAHLAHLERPEQVIQQLKRLLGNNGADRSQPSREVM